MNRSNFVHNLTAFMEKKSLGGLIMNNPFDPEADIVTRGHYNKIVADVLFQTFLTDLLITC